MTETIHPLRVFLCHSSGDKLAVIELYKRLVEDGIDAWLDKEKLIPGQDWQVEISKAVKNSDIILVCLSSQSVTKEGFVQKEIKFALDVADEKPEGIIFIIPVRLENCDVPERISKLHWVDLFSDDGYERLLKALQIRAKGIGTTIKSKSVKLSKSVLVASEHTSNELVISYPEVVRPINLGFEGAISWGLPNGWFNSAGHVDGVSTHYEINVIERPDNGVGSCVIFQNLSATKDEFGSLMQRCPAKFLAGKVIKFEGELKTKNVEQWAGLWLRADGIDEPTLYFDNMHKHRLRGTNAWKKYVIDAPLPKETAWLNYGIVLSGKGTIWADNFRLLVWEDNEWQEV